MTMMSETAVRSRLEQELVHRDRYIETAAGCLRRKDLLGAEFWLGHARQRNRSVITLREVLEG